ncbi:MAG: flavodoxin family protein, partial [Clostridiales bacterium]|nr:flavodoxin family protein [Clostridiales bacterium]
ARNNGSCAFLIDSFVKGFITANANIVKYDIGDVDLHFCKGCKKCYVDGRCVQNDDVLKIVQDILTSDIVVIAAPSYWADVPGQLKTLFDRTTPYGDTNPNRILAASKPIKGIAVAVRAGVREQENELILNAIEHYYGHLGIETIKRISITQTDKLSDLIVNHGDDIAQITELGKTLSQ